MFLLKFFTLINMIVCGNNALTPCLVNGTCNIGTRHGCLRKGVGVGRNLPLDVNFLNDYAPIDATRIYCGNQNVLPVDYDRFGSIGDCLRKGVGVGKRIRALDGGAQNDNVYNQPNNIGNNFGNNHRRGTLIFYIAFFLIINMTIFILLYYVKPLFILKKNISNEANNVDNVKFIIYSILISICIFIVFFVIKKFFRLHI